MRTCMQHFRLRLTWKPTQHTTTVKLLWILPINLNCLVNNQLLWCSFSGVWYWLIVVGRGKWAKWMWLSELATRKPYRIVPFISRVHRWGLAQADCLKWIGGKSSGSRYNFKKQNMDSNSPFIYSGNVAVWLVDSLTGWYYDLDPS